MTSSPLRDRSARILDAFSPDHLRMLGHRLADLLADHLTRVEAGGGHVLNWAEPPENIARAAQILAESPRTDSELTTDLATLARRFDELVTTMLDRGHNLHNPRYIGHQVPAPVPIAGLFDAVGAVTNQVMAIYEMGPWATAVERSLVDQLGLRLGWPAGSFAGLVTNGGSLGNLTGLLTARNVMLGDVWETGLSDRDHGPVLIAHQDAHYSVARAAGLLGIGTRNVLRAGLDARRRMDPDQLDDLLGNLRREGRSVFAVSACSCATPIGAFDPLREIADVCRRHSVWLHVDAAHGGAACMSRKYRSLLDGIELADSLVLDAHKMMFVPSLCAFVFYKNREHRFEAFRQDAPYLFDPSAPGLAEYDSGMFTPECTKRAVTYGLWGVWSLFGPQLFEDLLDATFDLGRVFYEKLAAAPDFEPMHEPQCNIVAFRHVPDTLRDASEERITRFLLEVRREIIQSGEFYIVQARLDGRQALRCTIINPLTAAHHLDELMQTIRDVGQRLLRSSPVVC